MGPNNGFKFVLGVMVGAIVCLDTGGLIGKTVVTFMNGLNAGGFFTPASARMCSSMTAPMGITLTTFLGGKRKSDAVDRENAKSAFLLSFCYIEEAVIPFLVNDPIRIVASCMIGGAVTSGLCIMTMPESSAVHDGVLVIAITSNLPLFVDLRMLGSCITGVLYALSKKSLVVQEENE